MTLASISVGRGIITLLPPFTDTGTLLFTLEASIIEISLDVPQISVIISTEPSNSDSFIFTEIFNLSDVPEASYS